MRHDSPKDRALGSGGPTIPAPCGEQKSGDSIVPQTAESKDCGALQLWRSLRRQESRQQIQIGFPLVATAPHESQRPDPRLDHGFAISGEISRG